MRDDVLALVSAERGHFLLESGYHATMWLDLETLFVDPARIDPLANELADRIARHEPDVICGPLVEGAFLGLAVARRLHLPFTYSERGAASAEGLYPYGYALPRALRQVVAGKRVAIVNDVISAGSAVRGTFVDLERCAATVVAIAALLVLGNWSREFTATQRSALEVLAEEPFELSTAADCAQCREGMPLQRRIQTT